FQDARLARGLTLDEAARLTKIRPSRLAEIEADDFSQFPSLAYAKGFLQIYGKFLDVDVTPYLDAFETSQQMTVDGYAYLQAQPAQAQPTQAPVAQAPPKQAPAASIAPVAPAPSRAPSRPPAAVVEAQPKKAAEPVATVAPSIPIPDAFVPAFANANAAAKASVPPKEPEVRRAEPVRPEDLAKAGATQTAQTTQKPAEAEGPNRIAIKPLKKTYIKVVVDNESLQPAFERWISPTDGTVEFRGQKIAVRVLDRDAIQIRKNGKPVADGDSDVTVE